MKRLIWLTVKLIVIIALAAWIIARLAGVEAAESAMHYVAPVGEKELYVERAMAVIGRYSGAAPKRSAPHPQQVQDRV